MAPFKRKNLSMFPPPQGGGGAGEGVYRPEGVAYEAIPRRCGDVTTGLLPIAVPIRLCGHFSAISASSAVN
jgi:hypothetical protein